SPLRRVAGRASERHVPPRAGRPARRLSRLGRARGLRAVAPLDGRGCPLRESAGGAAPLERFADADVAYFRALCTRRVLRVQGPLSRAVRAPSCGPNAPSVALGRRPHDAEAL